VVRVRSLVAFARELIRTFTGDGPARHLRRTPALKRSMKQLLDGPPVPLSVLLSLGRRLPPEEERLLRFLGCLMRAFSDRGYPRKGTLDAGGPDEQDLAAALGFSAEQAIREARAYIMGRARCKKGPRRILPYCSYGSERTWHAIWECSDDSESVRFWILSGWRFRLRVRCLCLFGWEDLTTSFSVTAGPHSEDEVAGNARPG
jgi:hypothetical protein